MIDIPIPSDWWKQLEKVEHTWGEPVKMDYYDGETKMVRWCTVCNAMLWDWGEPDKDAQYHSCRIGTDWPGDDAPCICTRRSYLEAHGIIEPRETPKVIKMTHIEQAMQLRDQSKARLAKVGAVLTRNDEIVAKAYNADYNYAYDELENPTEQGLVTKPEILHAEERIIADCANLGRPTYGTKLVITLAPCFRCARMILAAGIKEIEYKDDWWDKEALKYLEKHGVKVKKI